MKNRAVIEHISLGMGVFDGIGTLERGGELRDRLVNFSAKPQAPGQHRPNRCSRILAGAARGQLLHLVARLEELYGSSALFYGFGQSSQEKKNPCVSAPCIEHYGPIVVLFGEGDQIVTGTYQVIRTIANEAQVKVDNKTPVAEKKS